MEPRERADVEPAQLLAKYDSTGWQAARRAGVGVWLDETFHFGGGRDTRKVRNLMANPEVVVHTESGDDVVILEGVAEEITEPSLLARIDDAYEAKYGIRHGTPVWALRPRVAFAWSTFPKDVTRWLFDPHPAVAPHALP